jgi:O-methyltransferase
MLMVERVGPLRTRVGKEARHASAKGRRSGRRRSRNAGGYRRVINYAKKFCRTLVMFLVTPVILGEYLRNETGREYGIGLSTKIVLALKMLRNTRKIPTVSYFFEHIAMATRIMQIPRSTSGCIVECGCYAGGSTANLSLVCSLTGRQLEVFDSFQGLPNMSESDRTYRRLGPQHDQTITYTTGEFQSSLKETKANVSRGGDVRVCNFNVGYFDKTLLNFSSDSAFAFLDVDLRSSLETCVEHLWPLLQEGSYLFIHEAQEVEVVSLFFDREWWQKRFGLDPPGLVGAGSGLGLVPRRGGFESHLAFTLKTGS